MVGYGAYGPSVLLEADIYRPRDRHQAATWEGGGDLPLRTGWGQGRESGDVGETYLPEDEVLE